MQIRYIGISGIALLIVAAGLVFGADSPKGDRLQLSQLQNMAYKCEDATGGVARLMNGRFDDAPYEPGAATHLVVELGDAVAHGDMDGDGTPDAAVVLISEPGGSGTFYELAVVLNGKTHPVHVASVDLGDRIQIHSVTIKDRTVIVDMNTQAPNDPMSEHTLHVIHKYTLKRNRLVEKN